MIERLVYNLENSQQEVFHFAEMTTLEVTAMKMPGYYFSINENGKIESIHKTFDDYLSRNK